MFSLLQPNEKRQLERIAQNAAILAAHIEATMRIAEQIIAEVELVIGCMHPMESREDISAMGGPREFLCKRCNTMVNETTSPEYFPAETDGGG